MRLSEFLPDLVLLIHALYSLFLLLGLVLIVTGRVMGWRWTRTPGFRVGHLAGTMLLLGRVWFALPCPLTVLEDRLRVQSAQSFTVAGPIRKALHDVTFRGTESHGFGGAAIFFAAIVVTVFLLTEASPAMVGVVASATSSTTLVAVTIRPQPPSLSN